MNKSLPISTSYQCNTFPQNIDRLNLYNKSAYDFPQITKFDLLDYNETDPKANSKILEKYMIESKDLSNLNLNNADNSDSIHDNFNSDKSINLCCLITEQVENLKCKYPQEEEIRYPQNQLLSICNDYIRSFLLNNKNKALEENLLYLVKTKEGSKGIQDIIENCSSSLVELFYSISKDHLYDLFVHHYANYFLQTLYFRLGHFDKCEIIEKITKTPDIIYENNNGLCSLIFVIENSNHQREVSLLLNFIHKNFERHKWNINFLRVLEAVICCFPYESILFIRDFALNNFYKLINIREGYFVLRSVVKISKSPEVQNLIYSYVSYNFVKFINGPNGSLLCQCILHNFTLKKYIHTKSYSKHLSNFTNKEKEDVKVDMNNPIINKIIKLLFANIQIWQKKSFKALLECSIKTAKEQFEKRLIKSMKKNEKPLEKIESIDTHWKFLLEIILNLNYENFDYVTRYLFENLLEKPLISRKCELDQIKKKQNKEKKKNSGQVSFSINNMYPIYYNHSIPYGQFTCNNPPLYSYSNNSITSSSSQSTTHFISNNSLYYNNVHQPFPYFLSSEQLPYLNKLESIKEKEKFKSCKTKKGN